MLRFDCAHQLAGPREIERWKARQQEHAQKREARAASAEVERRRHLNGAATDAPRALASPQPAVAGLSNPSPARSVHFAENGVGRPNGVGRGGNAQGVPNSASRKSGAGGRGGGAAAKVAAPVTCEGCNEAGHEFQKCPHRSDSAVEGSDEDGEEESEYEGEDDGGGDGSGSDDA